MFVSQVFSITNIKRNKRGIQRGNAEKKNIKKIRKITKKKLLQVNGSHFGCIIKQNVSMYGLTLGSIVLTWKWLCSVVFQDRAHGCYSLKKHG